MAELPCLS